MTQLKSNTKQLAGVHSTGNPSRLPHAHTGDASLPISPRGPSADPCSGSDVQGSFGLLTGPRQLTPGEIVQKGSSQALAEKELHQLGGEVLAAVPRGQLLQHGQGAGIILLGKDRRQGGGPEEQKRPDSYP